MVMIYFNINAEYFTSDIHKVILVEIKAVVVMNLYIQNEIFIILIIIKMEFQKKTFFKLNDVGEEASFASLKDIQCVMEKSH